MTGEWRESYLLDAMTNAKQMKSLQWCVLDQLCLAGLISQTFDGISKTPTRRCFE